MRTSTLPARPGGDTAMSVWASAMPAGARDFPRWTRTPGAKPLPLMVIHVPPERGPCLGEIEAMVREQSVLHAPWQQVSPVWHANPHAPQLAISCVVSTHAAPHSVCPGAQGDPPPLLLVDTLEVALWAAAMPPLPPVPPVFWLPQAMDDATAAR